MRRPYAPPRRRPTPRAPPAIVIQAGARLPRPGAPVTTAWLQLRVGGEDAPGRGSVAPLSQHRDRAHERAGPAVRPTLTRRRVRCGDTPITRNRHAVRAARPSAPTSARQPVGQPAKRAELRMSPV